LLGFCPGWPQTTILPISNSLIAGIMGVSHHTWPIVEYFLITPRRSPLAMTPHSPSQLPAPSNSNLLSVSRFACCAHFTKMGSHGMWSLCLVSLLASCFPGAHTLCHVSESHSFLWLRSIPLWIDSVWFIHLFVDDHFGCDSLFMYLVLLNF
jgi:hypothetical protein